ncbi:MAG: two-component sensor histidine kinase [Oscillospiraceae bacterium]|jgi:signal transduction histidine kinase|nr:two-component sensor histidine kinase [Oscillospiraceae bacterium]
MLLQSKAKTGKLKQNKKLRFNLRIWTLVLFCFLFVFSTISLFYFAKSAEPPFLICLSTIVALQAICLVLIFLSLRKPSDTSESITESKAQYGANQTLGLKNTSEAENNTETKALIEANNELASFNFTISHEIKAPVRAIDGYARIFLEDYGKDLDSEAYSIITNIRNICDETIDLSNKLLEYTRIAQEIPCNQIVDLKEMIQEVFDTLQASYVNGNAIKLNFESKLPAVLGDPVLLRQAITNILSNAIKFTRDQKEGLITTGCMSENGENVFFIRDNGAGFDMQFSQNLFGMFQRMHTLGEFEGSGVGLAIVKKIILLHEGKVWIIGEVGKGATVYFTFPSDKVLD